MLKWIDRKTPESLRPPFQFPKFPDPPLKMTSIHYFSEEKEIFRVLYKVQIFQSYANIIKFSSKVAFFQVPKCQVDLNQKKLPVYIL